LYMCVDWNTALSPQKDRFPSRDIKDSGVEAVQEIIDTCEISDVYRTCNPEKTQMTHVTIRGGEIANASRIDYFLATNGIKERIIQVDTLVSDDVPTDHRPTFMEFRWTGR